MSYSHQSMIEVIIIHSCLFQKCHQFHELMAPSDLRPTQCTGWQVCTVLPDHTDFKLNTVSANAFCLLRPRRIQTINTVSANAFCLFRPRRLQTIKTVSTNALCFSDHADFSLNTVLASAHSSSRPVTLHYISVSDHADFSLNTMLASVRSPS